MAIVFLPFVKNTGKTVALSEAIPYFLFTCNEEQKLPSVPNSGHIESCQSVDFPNGKVRLMVKQKTALKTLLLDLLASAQ